VKIDTIVKNAPWARQSNVYKFGQMANFRLQLKKFILRKCYLPSQMQVTDTANRPLLCNSFGSQVEGAQRCTRVGGVRDWAFFVSAYDCNRGAGCKKMDKIPDYHISFSAND